PSGPRNLSCRREFFHWFAGRPQDDVRRETSALIPETWFAWPHVGPRTCFPARFALALRVVPQPGQRRAIGGDSVFSLTAWVRGFCGVAAPAPRCRRRYSHTPRALASV